MIFCGSWDVHFLEKTWPGFPELEVVQSLTSLNQSVFFIAHVVLPRITLLWSSDVSMHSTDWATATDAGTAGSSFRTFALVLSGQEASTSSVNSYILVDSLELRWLNKMGKGITAASTILPKKTKTYQELSKTQICWTHTFKGGKQKTQISNWKIWRYVTEES